MKHESVGVAYVKRDSPFALICEFLKHVDEDDILICEREMIHIEVCSLRPDPRNYLILDKEYPAVVSYILGKHHETLVTNVSIPDIQKVFKKVA